MNLSAFKLSENFFDFKSLLGDLKDLRELSVSWKDEFTQGQMRVLALFGPQPSFERPSPFHSYLKPQKHPKLSRFSNWENFLSLFEDQLLMARCIFLAPGTRVLPHRDPNRSFEFGVARLNVPLVHLSDMSLAMNGDNLDPCLGDIWFLDGATEHSVLNSSSSERVSLVLDVKISEPLLRHFPEFARQAYGEMHSDSRWGRPQFGTQIDIDFELPSSRLPFLNPSEDLVHGKIRVSQGKGSLLFLGHNLELDFNSITNFYSPRWVGPGFSYRPHPEKLEIVLKGLVPTNSREGRTFEWREEVPLITNQVNLN